MGLTEVDRKALSGAGGGHRRTRAQPDPNRVTYTVAEAARLLGVGRNQAYEAVRTGELPAIKLGKRILIPRAALEAMLRKAA